jgi:hypothetical protein
VDAKAGHPWKVVFFGDIEGLEGARLQVLVIDGTAVFDPASGHYVVQEGDEKAITSRRSFEVGTKHFICRTKLHILDLIGELPPNVDISL